MEAEVEVYLLVKYLYFDLVERSTKLKLEILDLR